MVEFKFKIENKKFIPKNICGVYAIRNNLNNNMYIGSSVNIYRRFTVHYYNALKGKLNSKSLQEDVNKIGIDKFSFIILEECDEVADTLKYLECKYIEQYGYYNTNSVDGKPVYSYDKYGKFVKGYVNIKAAAKDIDGFPDNVRAAIDKRKKSYKGLQWSHTKADYINPYCVKYYKYPEKSKTIDQFDLEGNYINTYESMHEANRRTGTSRANIAKVLKNQRRQANGFIWKYHNKQEAII